MEKFLRWKSEKKKIIEVLYSRKGNNENKNNNKKGIKMKMGGHNNGYEERIKFVQ